MKLHCHVQCFAVDDPALSSVYETCVMHDKPLLVHAGREPSGAGYKCDPHALCHVDRVKAVLRAYPKLRLAIPHLGLDEIAGYRRLLEQHDNLVFGEEIREGHRDVRALHVENGTAFRSAPTVVP